jgi:hypothetical protein
MQMKPPASVLWSLLWRAIVAFPLTMVAWVFVIVLAGSVVVLPLAAILYGGSGDWTSAGLSVLAWFGSFGVFRLVWRWWLKDPAGWEHGAL